MLPAAARAASLIFWTPFAVAARAARFLVRQPRTRVLDVGSGVGKFCIVGAGSTDGHFVGIEHREHLVRIAKRVATRAGVDRTEFVHGPIDFVERAAFDAFYLYNPFEENLCTVDERLDDTVSMSEARFAADVERVRTLLLAARVGTRIVTYNGFGGTMPAGYTRLGGGGHVRLGLAFWVKIDSEARRAKEAAVAKSSGFVRSTLRSSAPTSGVGG